VDSGRIRGGNWGEARARNLKENRPEWARERAEGVSRRAPAAVFGEERKLGGLCSASGPDKESTCALFHGLNGKRALPLVEGMP